MCIRDRIFTKPQVVVTIVSAFVKEAYRLRNTGVTDTSNLSYIEQGQFTEAFIKSDSVLARCLVSDAGFKEKEVIELLQITLVVAPINESDCFMPCLLPYCPAESIDKDTSTQCVAPTVIKLPGECVPHGFFCALVCSLLSRWKLHHKCHELAKVFKNYICFDIEDMDCSVATVDSFSFISIHVFGDCGREECKEIRDDIRASIESVVTQHNYEKNLVMTYDEDINFLCLCGKTPEHFSTLTKRGKLKLKCTMNQPLVLTEKHAVWFNDEQYLKWERQQLSLIHI